MNFNGNNENFVFFSVLNKVSEAKSSVDDYRRTMTENMHHKFINALNKLSRKNRQESDYGGSSNSSDDGFSEEYEKESEMF